MSVNIHIKHQTGKRSLMVVAARRAGFRILGNADLGFSHATISVVYFVIMRKCSCRSKNCYYFFNIVESKKLKQKNALEFLQFNLNYVSLCTHKINVTGDTWLKYKLYLALKHNLKNAILDNLVEGYCSRQPSAFL